VDGLTNPGLAGVFRLVLVLSIRVRRGMERFSQEGAHAQAQRHKKREMTHKGLAALRLGVRLCLKGSGDK
jgi:hypothetical protein